MIEIKRNNYITGDVNSVSFGLSKIIHFLDTSGRNILFLHQPKDKDCTTLKYILNCSKLEFKDYDDLKDILNEDGNLFRIDLIVIDLWKFNIDVILKYQNLIYSKNIDYIVVSGTYHYIEGDENTMVYKIEKIPTDDLNNLKYKEVRDYYVTELISGWKSSIKNLIVTYRRDKKIDDIFGDGSY